MLARGRAVSILPEDTSDTTTQANIWLLNLPVTRGREQPDSNHWRSLAGSHSLQA